MTNVKVHLKEIIKYVLLLGFGIQIVLGTICSILWLTDLQGFAERCKALGGMILCIACGYIFLRLWNKEWSRKLVLFGAIGAASTPMVLQAGLNISAKSIYGFLLAWLFVVLLWVLRLNKGKIVKYIGVLVVFVLAIGICNIENTSTSFAAKMTSRFCYPHLYAGVINAPQELLDEAGYIELRDSLRSADGINTILYPALVERYETKADADGVCWKLVKYGFTSNTKNVVYSILWDYVGYHLPLPVSEMQLGGLGYDAVTGYHYGKLLEATGRLGSIYWGYSVAWYGLMVLLLTPIGIRGMLRSSIEKKLLLLLLEVTVICLVMQGAGLFDYTKLQVVQFIWMSQALRCIEKVKTDEESELE